MADSSRHLGISGNEESNECAVNGQFMDKMLSFNDHLNPWDSVANITDDWEPIEITSILYAITHQNFSKNNENLLNFG